MKSLKCLFFSLILFFPALAAKENIHQDIIISLLTTESTTQEVYTAFGHTAIRVQVPDKNIDMAFNYGIFSFSDGFIYKFVKGETDYRLGVTSYENALKEAKDEKNVFMYEQVLNLTGEEKEKLFTSLLENAQPENKYYRYNFFFDNCATRPMLQIEKAIDGTIHYPILNNTYTFRDLIYQKLADSPWYVFGIDLCLGSETDRIITDRELLFLPEELMRSYSESTIVTAEENRPLVSEFSIVNYPDESVKNQSETSTLFTPVYICWFFFFLIVIHTIFYNYNRKKDLWMDIILFSSYGLLGCLIFFLTFISEHPCTNPNYNLLWTNPLQLIFAILVLFKKLRKPLIFYQLLNIILVATAIIGWYFIPQHYNNAFLPLMLAILLRSGNYILHYKKF
jgi:hypothetical protein